MRAPTKKIEPTGFQTFSMRGKPCTRQDMIDHLVEQGGRVFSFAPTEPDNISKAMCSDGERIWLEDSFGNYLYDI